MIPKGNLHATETTVIDGIEYETIELGSDFAQNTSKIKTDPNGNYRYVMTADFDMRWTEENNGDRRIGLYGASVIFDLNGFTLITDGWAQSGGHFSYFITYCTELKLTDSSVMQSGRLNTPSIVFHNTSACKSMVVDGGSGTLVCSGSGSADTILTINSGRYSIYVYSVLFPKTIIAPYLQTYYDGDELRRVTPYDAYAVSASNLVSGIYNTAYGYQWDLNAHTLSNLTLPTDKTYYLWARDADSKYTYLNLRYDHDQKTWVTAD